MKSCSESYRRAGVDITAGYRAVELMKQYIARTMTENVLSGLGGFGGLFELPEGLKKPVLVAGTDGVGTKLKLSFLLKRYDTVGIDCVAMCVNDVICCGARPLFFLDYIACGKNVPERIAELVKGVSEGCVQAGSSLIGGETAEMPGFYPEDEYALPSSGVHSNGFSLIRKVFDLDRISKEEAEEPLALLGGRSLGESLLLPTRIYVKPLLSLMERVELKGLSHITGGGFYENIPRSIPDGLGARIRKRDVRVLPIFRLIEERGEIPERDMYNTFNMGVGMTLIVSREQEEKALSLLLGMGLSAYSLGEIVSSREKLLLE